MVASLHASADTHAKDDGKALGAGLRFEDFGAIGDGRSHPLAEFYSTLAEAHLRFPFARSLSDEMDSCAIQSALYAAGHTRIGLVEPRADAIYMVDRYFTSTKPVSVWGAGRSSVFRIAGDRPNILFYFGGAIPNGTPNPTYAGSVYAAGTHALLSGQRTFNLTEVKGLTEGDQVFMALGIDPTDGGQHSLRLWNSIESIRGNSVTMRRALPEGVAAFPISPAFSFSPRAHEIIKFDDIYEDVEIGNFTIEQGGGEIGDSLIMIFRARRVATNNIHLSATKAGVYFQEVENATFRNLTGDMVRNTMASFAGCSNVRGSNLRGTRLIGPGLYLENQCRNAQFERLFLSGDRAKSNTAYVAVLGGSRDIRIREWWNRNHRSTPNAHTFVVDKDSQCQTENVTLDGDGNNVFPLKQHVGQISYGGQRFERVKRRRRRIRLAPNMAAVEFSIDSGLTKTIKASITNRTGVVRLVLINQRNEYVTLIDTGNQVDLLPSGAAFGTLMNDHGNTIGTDPAFQFNNCPWQKRVQITTDSTAVAGAILDLYTETFVP